jgi:hypothetical protein
MIITRAAFVLILCASSAGIGVAGKLFSVTEPDARAVWIGSPEIPYRASLIIKLPVSMKKGEVANFVAEAEGSIYSFSKLPEFYFLDYTMFQTSTVLVFKPDATPPETIPVHAKDHVWQIDTNAIGAKQLFLPLGVILVEIGTIIIPLLEGAPLRPLRKAFIVFHCICGEDPPPPKQETSQWYIPEQLS